MKKLLFLFGCVILILTSLKSFAQCPTSSTLQLISQEDVNSFVLEYPDCTEIEGWLIIGGGSPNDIDDLTPLQNIETIEKLTIQYTSLIDLSDLSNVSSLESLNVLNNTELISLDGLEGLTSTNGIKLSGNPVLNDLSGLVNITEVGDVDNTGLQLEIYNNAALESLNGLNNIEKVWGETTIEWNQSLESLSGLDGVSELVGHVRIATNSSLQNLSGLDNLSEISNGLFIFNNSSLADLSALANLASFNGSYLTISSNQSLTTLYGLDNFDHATLSNLVIESSVNLNTCHVPSICEYLGNGGSHSINGNAFGCSSDSEIEDLCGGFPDCPPGSVTFTTQAQLDQFIIDYPNCTAIQGDLYLGDGLDFVNINDCNPLQNIESVYGDIFIQGTELVDLSGLENLVSIQGALVVYFNPYLQNLNGLGSIETLGNDLLRIDDNAELASLEGLENINPESISSLSIQYNANLDVCNVESVCVWLSTFENQDSWYIAGNQPNCESQEAILLNCQSILPECPSGDLTFSSQEEVDHFILQYPNCSLLEGDLNIGTNLSSDINDLTPFENIEYILGSLVIQETQLSDFNGLQSLTSIGGVLEVIYNQELLNVSGLNNLSFLGLSMTFLENDQLTTLEDLGPIQYAEHVHITGNDALLNLQGLNDLETVSADGGIFSVNNNSSLISLIGVENFTSGAIIKVEGNSSLQSLEGFDNLQYAGSMRIFENFSLASIGSLANLDSIGGNLLISSNPILESLEGFETLLKVGQLTVLNNDVLANLSGLESLEDVSLNFTVIGNAQMTSLEGLESLLNIGSSIDIQENEVLNDLTSLAQIDHVQSTISVRLNDAMVNLEGLHNVESAGSLVIEGNPLLQDLLVFSNLTTLEGNGSIHIAGNDALSSIEGLQYVDPITLTYLRLESSASLGLCAFQNICTYLEDGGEADISGNAAGCSSQLEIEEACELISGVNDTGLDHIIKVFPNPAENQLTIKMDGPVLLSKIELIDVTGKVVLSENIEVSSATVDIAPISSGIYLLRVHSHQGMWTKQILKY